MKLERQTGAKLLLCGLLLWAFPCLGLAQADPKPVKAAVIRSTGTFYLGMTIWNDLNTGWDRFGTTPVQIDYTSLAGNGWGLPEIQATGANVLILSNPAFWNYTTDEMSAVRQYVESGHGLIISYGKFRSADKALAPLVGLSESIRLGTNTWPDPFTFDVQVVSHPVFAGISLPYATGVLTLASPQSGASWDFTESAALLATATPEFQGFTGNGVIVANQGIGYRGLYFSNYIENKSGGANQQDMQVFYNGLVWTGTPEPASAMLLLAGSVLLTRRRASARSHARMGSTGQGAKR